MTVRLVDFERGHLELMVPQEAQRGEAEFVFGQPLGQSWTAMVDGQPICIGGHYEIWPGRAYAWGLLSAGATLHMVSLTRAIRFQLDAATFARIEMVVDKDFRAARRWAELLGFQLETPTPLRRFFPNGHDALMYARIK